MAVIRGLVLLFLVFLVENAEAQAKPCKPKGAPKLLPRPIAPAKKCPIGWKRFRAQCYKFFPQTVNWATAEKNCQAVGGNLPSPRTKARNDFLLSLVPRNTHVWIGGHDCEVEGQWLWSNGAKFDYNNWCQGEPNNLGGRENCLEINWTEKRCWNDSTCTGHKAYICARKRK